MRSTRPKPLAHEHLQSLPRSFSSQRCSRPSVSSSGSIGTPYDERTETFTADALWFRHDCEVLAFNWYNVESLRVAMTYLDGRMNLTERKRGDRKALRPNNVIDAARALPRLCALEWTGEP